MMNEKKSNVWDLEVETLHRYRVCFDEPVTLENAIARFNRGAFEDVIDTEELDAIAIGVPFDE